MEGSSRSLISTLVSDAKALLQFAHSMIRRALYDLKGCISLEAAKKWVCQLTSYNRCLHGVRKHFQEISKLGLEVPSVPEADQEVGLRLDAFLNTLPLDINTQKLHRSLSNQMVLEELISAHYDNETRISSQPNFPLGSPLTTRISHNSVDDFPTIESEVNSLDTFGSFFHAPLSAKPTPTSPQVAKYAIFLDELLGKGSFGCVYKGWDQDLGRHVACKLINQRPRSSMMDPGQGVAAVSELQAEFNVLKTLSHPNIVNVFDFEVTPTSSRIYMEWMPSGSVQGILTNNKKIAANAMGLREQVVRRYASEALSGLIYLHKKGIIHCDVKPANMLLVAAEPSSYPTSGRTKSWTGPPPTTIRPWAPFHTSPPSASTGCTPWPRTSGPLVARFSKWPQARPRGTSSA